MGDNFEDQRKKIIGLGATSHRKSYYPELQEQILELKRKNEELQAINEELIATEEELHKNYQELKNREQELLESRANFQDVLDNSIVAIYKRNYVTDTYDYVSPAITEINGYSPEETMKFPENKVLARVHPEDRNQVVQKMQEIVSQGGGTCFLEYRYLHKDGQELWLKDILRIVVDSSGRPLCSIGSIQDNTELKTIELIAKKAQEKLVHLNNVTFQDILNTNYALTGYIDLIRESNTDECLFHYLDAVDALIRKNENILQNSKEFQDMGSKPPRWHVISITVLNALSHLDLSYLTRTLELEGLECYADPLLEHAFFSIFENILLHSRKATHYSITSRQNPESISLIIEDDGVGIPDDNKEIIFEKTYLRRKGMGLFLVRAILSLTGITIKEKGEWGKGARFEITIPAKGYRINQGDLSVRDKWKEN